jgi:hypothetical protein
MVSRCDSAGGFICGLLLVELEVACVVVDGC